MMKCETIMQMMVNVACSETKICTIERNKRVMTCTYEDDRPVIESVLAVFVFRIDGKEVSHSEAQVFLNRQER